MFWIVHILIGMIIGVKFKSPWLVIPIALLSHFVLDAIPHWDGNFDKKKFKKTRKVVINDIDMVVKFLDIIGTISVLIYFYMQSDRGMMLLGAVMAILPDMSKIGYLTKLKDTKGYMRYIMFHNNIQGETSIIDGLSVQVIFFISMVAILLQMI
jgi:hypothetical protein